MMLLLFVILSMQLISLILCLILIPMILPFASFLRLIPIVVFVKCSLFRLLLLMLRRFYVVKDKLLDLFLAFVRSFFSRERIDQLVDGLLDILYERGDLHEVSDTVHKA